MSYAATSLLQQALFDSYRASSRRIVWVKFPDRRIACTLRAARTDEENGVKGEEVDRMEGRGMNGHEILLTVHGICNSGGRVLVGRAASRVVGVDQGEVAPLFSVWMRDKRNRGCFGQTLFGHGQPTYKRAQHPSPRFTWRCALFVLSHLVHHLYRPFPFLYFIIHNSRVPCMQCTYTRAPIAFSLALCLMNVTPISFGDSRAERCFDLRKVAIHTNLPTCHRS